MRQIERETRSGAVAAVLVALGAMLLAASVVVVGRPPFRSHGERTAHTPPNEPRAPAMSSAPVGERPSAAPNVPALEPGEASRVERALDGVRMFSAPDHPSHVAAMKEARQAIDALGDPDEQIAAYLRMAELLKEPELP
jgi:hypothetical protein